MLILATASAPAPIDRHVARGDERASGRYRAREIGVTPGVLAPGPLNAITDVDGVKVGQVTITDGNLVHTGVTAVLPHGGNLYQEKVPAGVVVGNGFGKMTGIAQISELGEIETPIVLTNTLSVPEVAAGVIDWTLSRPGNGDVQSVNAVIGETNDRDLNDIRRRVVTSADARLAIESAQGGPVAEGSVGAGAGTRAFDWKGGIGTSSRRLPKSLGGYTVGVLVQTNFGGVLSVDGAPVGKDLQHYYLRDALRQRAADGSIMIVVAVDAPLSDRNLRRLAQRALFGLARTGAAFSNGSGDFAIAFSTAANVRRTAARRAGVATIDETPNDSLSPLFLAAAEATEEAIYNSLFMASDVSVPNAAPGAEGLGRAIDLKLVRALLRKHRVINRATRTRDDLAP